MRPIAPLGDSAPGLKFDSAATMLFTNAVGTWFFRAAERMRARVSLGKIGGGGSTSGTWGPTTATLSSGNSTATCVGAGKSWRKAALKLDERSAAKVEQENSMAAAKNFIMCSDARLFS